MDIFCGNILNPGQEKEWLGELRKDFYASFAEAARQAISDYEAAVSSYERNKFYSRYNVLIEQMERHDLAFSMNMID